MERSHLLTGAALLLILILATAMTLALRGAPAIDRTARLPGAAGDWRVADGPSMYLRPDYLYRLGLGYLEAAGVGSAAPQSETPPADLMRERAETARDLLSESLRLAPADARTWTALASANARLDLDEDARAALFSSWDLAPHTLLLAVERVALAEVIPPPPDGTPERERWARAVKQDVEILERSGLQP
jgi:hypothetical protein